MADNYLIIGDDVYIRDREREKIRDKYLSGGDKELNYSVFGPGDMENISDALGTMPFLSDRRVIAVKEAQDLSQESWDIIASYLAKPHESSILILVVNAAFSSNKNYRKIEKHINLIKAGTPDKETMKSWIRGFFRKEGMEILPSAVDLMLELKGTEASDIKNELEKLVCYVGERKEISAEDVETVVGRSVSEDIFQLVDAINRKDAGRIFRVVNDLYDKKRRPEEIIGYVAWYARTIQRVFLLKSKGVGTEGIARDMGRPVWQIKRVVNDLAKYSEGKIRKWVEMIFAADIDIKTGVIPADMAVERLLIGLAGGIA
ncbi:MAG: DNA polymerase III subunit delta [Candidatus Omnitrophica bacterium]|nr:DNA polymerase III subunit delta [Candidatus Omnitrophota bacterium]MDD5488939.1 DNA polymerase III subunit delta [Candidatus Omnitrophota bacterium]